MPVQAGLPSGILVRSQRVVPVTTATPDYSSGDAVGGLLTFTDFVRGSPGGGKITRIFVKSKVAIAVDCILHLFDANPSASTFADNGALTIHADDWAKVIKSQLIVAADFVTQGAGLTQADKSVSIPFETAGAPNLYAILEARGAINLASASDLEVWLGQESG